MAARPRKLRAVAFRAEIKTQNVFSEPPLNMSRKKMLKGSRPSEYKLNVVSMTIIGIEVKMNSSGTGTPAFKVAPWNTDLADLDIIAIPHANKGNMANS